MEISIRTRSMVAWHFAFSFSEPTELRMVKDREKNAKKKRFRRKMNYALKEVITVAYDRLDAW